MKKEMKKNILEVPLEQNSKKHIIIILIALILLVILIFIGVSFYIYFQSPEKQLSLGANIEEVRLSPEEDVVYIKLEGGINYGNITKIKFIFKDVEGKEYNYETSEGASEISVPFKRSFWAWFFGWPRFVGKYNYEIKADEINLNNFNNINEVSVVFEYKTETNQTIITPPLDTTKPTPPKNQTTTGGGGGGTTTEPTTTCTDDTGCSVIGIFCQDNVPYNCTTGSDRCLDRVNLTACAVNETCINGNCVVLKNCTSNNNCSYLNKECSYGVCNASNKCGVAYNVNETICNDSLFCTINDVCDGVGNCQGTARDCSDAIACTDDNCNKINDKCDNIINNSKCNYPQETCNETQGCITNLCIGLTSCSDYTDAFNCTNNPCSISGGCEWNTTINACEPTGVNMTSSISQFNITWYFDKEYEYGTFANGDYWVVGPVVITSITPSFDGNHHGWQSNPMPGYSQGFDNRTGFNASLVPSLPYTAYPNESIVKTVSIEPLNNTSCRPCLEVAAVLTILDKPAPEGSFRPSYVGNEKTLYNISQLKTNLLPSLPSTQSAPSLDSIKNAFQKVQLDHKLSWSGAAIHPRQNMPEYGASIAIRNANGALRLMLNDSIENKMPAVINYIQMGIDFYGILKNGGGWGVAISGGGGHGGGRKLPIALAAVLLDNQEMKDAVSNVNEDDNYKFGENGDIRFSQKANYGKGIALYAQINNNGYYYWRKLANNSASGSKTYKDPYGYIDGGQVPGSIYLSCCISQPSKATSIAVRLIPELRRVWNDEYFHDFLDRYIDFGIWTQPDPCAPPTGECNTTKIPCTLANQYDICTGGEYCDTASKFSTDYGVKYGPDPTNSSNCILDTEPSDGIGRVPKLHETYKDQGDHYGSYGSVFANKMWDAYRKIYSCVWVYDNVTNWHYDCSQCQYNCLSSPYCGDGACNGNETSESCEWDCGNIVQSFSPFAKLWNWIKSLLTAKTGKAITGNVITDSESLEKSGSFLEKLIKWFKRLI